MRVAALYDIHGNLPALRAVLGDVAGEGVDTIVFGGDVVPGPLPRETIEQLMALGHRARLVRGNGDREVIEAYDSGRTDFGAVEDPAQRAAAHAAAHISGMHRDFLAEFAPVVGLDVDGLGSTLFCHGSPRSDTEILTRVTTNDRARRVLSGTTDEVVVCGHTHQQFDRSVHGRRLVNAGSVGMPYEGHPGAYWALLGPAVELRRTEYDLDQALGELRAGGFPDLDEMLAESLLEPAEPGAVAAFFERQADP
jgi:predicted phosphodiesterase